MTLLVVVAAEPSFLKSPLLLLEFEPKYIKDMSYLQNYRSVRKVLPDILASKMGLVEKIKTKEQKCRYLLLAAMSGPRV